MTAGVIKADKQYDIDYIDCSGSGRFGQCPAKYFFERILGLENQDRDRTALDYGTDMHYVFPMCYGAANSDEELALASDATEKFEQLRDKRTYDKEDKKHGMEATENRIANFVELHAKGVCPYKIIKFPFTTPEEADVISDNEVPFAIDIGGPLAFLGRIDFPAKLVQTDELFAGDYKTASEISGRLWDAFDLNCQAIGYTLALSHVSNEKVSGMLIEAIRKSATIKKVEVAIHYQYVTDYEIELFIDYLNSTAMDITDFNEIKEWPKKLSGCNTYSTTGFPGGNCPFKLLCKAKDWREMASYYHQAKPFHPFKVETGV